MPKRDGPWELPSAISSPLRRVKPPPGPGRGGSEFYTPMGDCFSLACENLPNSKTISIRTADFDGLKMPVVRFEVDGCLRSDQPGPKATIRKSRIDDDDLEAALSGALSGLSIGTSSRSTTTSETQSPLTSTDLKIIRAGAQVPQSSLFEMTTRSEISAANFDWGDAFPQLYLPQTPNHYLAVHRTGRFSSIAKRKIGEKDLIAIEAKAHPGVSGNSGRYWERSKPWRRRGG